VAQTAECLLCKCKALSSNPNSTSPHKKGTKNPPVIPTFIVVESQRPESKNDLSKTKLEVRGSVWSQHLGYHIQNFQQNLGTCLSWDAQGSKRNKDCGSRRRACRVCSLSLYFQNSSLFLFLLFNSLTVKALSAQVCIFYGREIVGAQHNAFELPQTSQGYQRTSPKDAIVYTCHFHHHLAPEHSFLFQGILVQRRAQPPIAEVSGQIFSLPRPGMQKV
jgi:hypothetical protein